MLHPARLLAPAFAACLWLSGCASDRAQPLAQQPGLASGVAALDRTRSGLAPIPADQPLGLDDVARLTMANSPDLRAARLQSGVAQAQVFQAGLLPDPVLSGNYGILFGGPGVANAIGAALTADVTALITLSARRSSAEAAAQQVDANVLWQEWQTMSRAKTLAIDLVKQARLLRSYRQTLDLLTSRAATSSRAVAQGNATLQTLAPDVAAVTSLQAQLNAATLAQEERWQAFDGLLGLQPQVRPALSETLDVLPIAAAAAAVLLSDLPRRRPDLVALQLGYRSQNAALRGAVLGQFPALTIGPSYGNDTARVQTLGPSVSLTLPIFNRNRGAIAIQSATREQLRAEYEARLDAADGGARALLDNLALLTRQLSAAQAGVGRAESLASSAAGAMRAGLLDELSFVQLTTARLEKERQVTGLEQQVLDTRVALSTLLGAGLPTVEITPAQEPERR